MLIINSYVLVSYSQVVFYDNHYHVNKQQIYMPFRHPQNGQEDIIHYIRLDIITYNYLKRKIEKDDLL